MFSLTLLGENVLYSLLYCNRVSNLLSSKQLSNVSLYRIHNKAISAATK